jgi:hypothetical protein
VVGDIRVRLGEAPTFVPRFELTYQVYEDDRIANILIKETFNDKSTEWDAEIPFWRKYNHL